MFRLVLFLSAAIFVTLRFGPQDDGPVRHGLVPGMIAPLVWQSDDTAKASKLAADSIVVPAPQADPAPEAIMVAEPARPAETAAAAEPVIEAAFVPAEPQPQSGGLTLALPLRDGSEGEPPAPALNSPVVRYVIGSSVNVRSGPSADTESLTKLARGEAVTVLPSDEPGWSMIRIEGDGVEGYIASRFLGETP